MCLMSIRPSGADADAGNRSVKRMPPVASAQLTPPWGGKSAGHWASVSSFDRVVVVGQFGSFLLVVRGRRWWLGWFTLVAVPGGLWEPKVRQFVRQLGPIFGPYPHVCATARTCSPLPGYRV